MTKISVVTSCGNKKRDEELPAWRLYKSSRITAVYNRKDDTDMFILSAEHGLVPAEKTIQPYDRIMDEKRCQELVPEIKKIVEKYDVVIFFKAGANRLYEQCITKACTESKVRLKSFGYRSMGGINDLPSEIRKAKDGFI